MAAVAQFLVRLQDHFIWLLGLILMIEPVLDSLWEDYRKKADQFISRKARTRASWSIAIIGAFVACFLSFRDEFDETQSLRREVAIAAGERDESRRLLQEARNQPSPAATPRVASPLYWQPLTLDETLKFRAEMRNVPKDQLPPKGGTLDFGNIKLPYGQVSVLCNDGFCSDLAGSIVVGLTGMDLAATLGTAFLMNDNGITIRPDNVTTRAIATVIETATNGRLLVSVVDEKQKFPEIIIAIGQKTLN